MESYHKDVFESEYEAEIKKICQDILKDQSAERLKHTRTQLVNLIVNCVPADVIFTEMVKQLCIALNSDEKKRQIIDSASFYDQRASQGAKALFHLEAFVAKAMLIIAEN